MSLKTVINKISEVSKYYQSKTIYKLADSYSDPWAVQMVTNTFNSLKSNPVMEHFIKPSGIEIQQSIDHVNCSFVLDFDAEEAQEVYATEATRKSLLTNALTPRLEGHFGLPATISYTENPYREY